MNSNELCLHMRHCSFNEGEFYVSWKCNSVFNSAPFKVLFVQKVASAEGHIYDSSRFDWYPSPLFSFKEAGCGIMSSLHGLFDRADVWEGGEGLLMQLSCCKLFLNCSKQYTKSTQFIGSKETVRRRVQVHGSRKEERHQDPVVPFTVSKKSHSPVHLGRNRAALRLLSSAGKKEQTCTPAEAKQLLNTRRLLRTGLSCAPVPQGQKSHWRTAMSRF